jgi:thiol-disulfide isomerase/thioredoxin
MVEGKQSRVWRSLGRGVLIWLGIIALAFGVSEFVGSRAHAAGPEVNALAPDFELENLAGERVRLSERLGKPLIINFWATWCAPCILEMPNIRKFYEKYPGQFDVLAVNANEPRRDVERFVDDMSLTFDVLLDTGGKTQQLYQIQGYPTSFVIDSQGVIRVEHIGLLTEDNLKDYLLKVGVGP